LRTDLAQRAGVKPEREFYLLAALGADLPGAVRVTPLEMEAANQPSQQVKIAKQTPDNVLHFSLAGIQLKFSAIMEASPGLTMPADGMNGSWITKLPSARFSAVPENEFVMLALARAIGMSLPANRLIDVREIHGLPEEALTIPGKALAVECFDRSADGKRIHMEDFAQIFGLFPESKSSTAS